MHCSWPHALPLAALQLQCVDPHMITVAGSQFAARSHVAGVGWNEMESFPTLPRSFWMRKQMAFITQRDNPKALPKLPDGFHHISLLVGIRAPRMKFSPPLLPAQLFLESALFCWAQGKDRDEKWGQRWLLDTKLSESAVFLKEGPWVFLGTGLPFLNPRIGPVFALVVPAQKRGPILLSKSASFLGFETAKFFQMLVHLGAPDGPVVNRCAFNDTFQNMDSVYQPKESPLRPGLLLFLTPLPQWQTFPFFPPFAGGFSVCS